MRFQFVFNSLGQFVFNSRGLEALESNSISIQLWPAHRTYSHALVILDFATLDFRLKAHRLAVAISSTCNGCDRLDIANSRGRAGQGRAGQGRAGAGQGRAGQGRAGQGRAGQGRAGQVGVQGGEGRRVQGGEGDRGGHFDTRNKPPFQQHKVQRFSSQRVALNLKPP